MFAYLIEENQLTPKRNCTCTPHQNVNMHDHMIWSYKIRKHILIHNHTLLNFG